MIKKSLPVIILAAMLIVPGLLIGFFSNSAGGATAATRQPRVGSSDGFSRAMQPVVFTFPRDHGPHPDFQTEWWYYTGNLQAEDGEMFGYQLTFFRRALQPPAARLGRESAWAADQVYLAHFALTSVSRAQFQFAERSSRGAAGLAGASGEPLYRVWLEDWKVEQLDEGIFLLKVRDSGVDLELNLVEQKGLVFHGNQGLSQIGPQPGNASYYISQTRLASNGTLVVGQEVKQVSGESWMDHEFSTSALSTGQVGWDWFSLQLSDQTELMMYTIRRADGTVDAFSQGTLVRADGSTRTLSQADFQIQPTGTWRSPKSEGVYPSGWQVKITGENIELTVNPKIKDQELLVSFTYWEGAVDVKGKIGQISVNGSGYVELTGYAHSMEGEF